MQTGNAGAVIVLMWIFGLGIYWLFHRWFLGISSLARRVEEMERKLAFLETSHLERRVEELEKNGRTGPNPQGEP